MKNQSLHLPAGGYNKHRQELSEKPDTQGTLGTESLGDPSRPGCCQYLVVCTRQAEAGQEGSAYLQLSSNRKQRLPTWEHIPMPWRTEHTQSPAPEVSVPLSLHPCPAWQNQRLGVTTGRQVTEVRGRSFLLKVIRESWAWWLRL